MSRRLPVTGDTKRSFHFPLPFRLRLNRLRPFHRSIPLLILGCMTDFGYAGHWSESRQRAFHGCHGFSANLTSERVRGHTHLDSGCEDCDFRGKLSELEQEACYAPVPLCRDRVYTSSMLRADTVNNDDSPRTVIALRYPWIEPE